jgi:hypothetical protein
MTTPAEPHHSRDPRRGDLKIAQHGDLRRAGKERLRENVAVEEQSRGAFHARESEAGPDFGLERRDRDRVGRVVGPEQGVV